MEFPDDKVYASFCVPWGLHGVSVMDLLATEEGHERDLLIEHPLETAALPDCDDARFVHLATLDGCGFLCCRRPNRCRPRVTLTSVLL